MTIVTCRTLIEESLPDLACSEENYRTLGASLTNSHIYEGHIEPWQDLDQEVHDYIYGSVPARLPNNQVVLFRRGPDAGRALFEQDRYLCAEEKGCEGRFNHHVMQILGHAAAVHPLGVRLGDFKATYEAQQSTGRLPDMCCMTTGGNPKQRARFFGECKADWTAKILSDYNSESQDRPEFRKWIKQIANYLRAFGLQYGFVTTYHHTIFVRYPHYTEVGPYPARGDRLYVSRPIPSSQEYRIGGSGGLPLRVTVRQVMWYLMLKATEAESEWKMTEKAEWKHARLSSLRPVKKLGMPPPPPASGKGRKGGKSRETGLAGEAGESSMRGGLSTIQSSPGGSTMTNVRGGSPPQQRGPNGPKGAPTNFPSLSGFAGKARKAGSPPQQEVSNGPKGTRSNYLHASGSTGRIRKTGPPPQQEDSNGPKGTPTNSSLPSGFAGKASGKRGSPPQEGGPSFLSGAPSNHVSPGGFTGKTRGKVELPPHQEGPSLPKGPSGSIGKTSGKGGSPPRQEGPSFLSGAAINHSSPSGSAGKTTGKGGLPPQQEGNHSTPTNPADKTSGKGGSPLQQGSLNGPRTIPANQSFTGGPTGMMNSKGEKVPTQDELMNLRQGRLPVEMATHNS